MVTSRSHPPKFLDTFLLCPPVDLYQGYVKALVEQRVLWVWLEGQILSLVSMHFPVRP